MFGVSDRQDCLTRIATAELPPTHSGSNSMMAIGDVKPQRRQVRNSRLNDSCISYLPDLLANPSYILERKHWGRRQCGFDQAFDVVIVIVEKRDKFGLNWDRFVLTNETVDAVCVH